MHVACCAILTQENGNALHVVKSTRDNVLYASIAAGNSFAGADADAYDAALNYRPVW